MRSLTEGPISPGMVLFATVRSTGAVMVPLAIMTVSLLLVRFPLADALLPR
ncbi:MAG: hypothetical protein ACREVO_18840 [Steroidobacteraceae bacterium]